MWTADVGTGKSGAHGAPGRIRVLRVIARMNVGGPAYHVSVLSGRLDPRRFETRLVHGEVGPGEASFADLAREYGASAAVIEHLGPEIRPVADAKALLSLIGVVRRFRPHIVHTHTAKAGALGRLAALLGGRPRPVIVHTYHGHVLEGYFGPAKSLFYRLLERSLAPVSDCLIGVSRATVEDLVRLGVASRGRFRVLPVGLDLGRFARTPARAACEVRELVGAAPDDVLVICVGRLVAIKRIDVLLEAFARVAADTGSSVRLAVVGDGELRLDLEALAARLGLERYVTFLGYMADVSGVAAAADIAALSSDNEGTPVALIEAAAAGTPAVSTAVGGVPDVVVDGRTGLLVPRGDIGAFAEALRRMIEDRGLRDRMGAEAGTHVLGRFSSDRLVVDIERLYEELLEHRRLLPAAVAAQRPT